MIRTIADYLSDAGLAGREPNLSNRPHTIKSATGIANVWRKLQDCGGNPALQRVQRFGWDWEVPGPENFIF
jgi:hypothetical protein